MKKAPCNDASYRIPLRVSAVVVFPHYSDLGSFPICPRCSCTMDREYQAYCDRCGQALDWHGFAKATVIRSR